MMLPMPLLTHQACCPCDQGAPRETGASGFTADPVEDDQTSYHHSIFGNLWMNMGEHPTKASQ